MRDKDKIIKQIIKDMRANRSVAEIAKSNTVSEVLVNEVLQIYTTHPGIDIQGILDRLPE